MNDEVFLANLRKEYCYLLGSVDKKYRKEVADRLSELVKRTENYIQQVREEYNA